jgi:hypothetical protein
MKKQLATFVEQILLWHPRLRKLPKVKQTAGALSWAQEQLTRYRKQEGRPVVFWVDVTGVHRVWTDLDRLVGDPVNFPLELMCELGDPPGTYRLLRIIAISYCRRLVQVEQPATVDEVAFERQQGQGWSGKPMTQSRKNQPGRKAEKEE